MTELWTELICIKEIGGIRKGTLAVVFRSVRKESHIWMYVRDERLNGLQFRIPKSLLKEHFKCLR